MQTMDCKGTYHFEEALHGINREFIKLSEEDVRLNKRIHAALLDVLIPALEKDALFKRMYEGIFFGGSYYDGLKISKPNEYDLDLLLKLPKIAVPRLILDENYPGYVKVKLNDIERLKKQPESNDYRKLFSWLDDEGYVIAQKIRNWMKSILQTALNNCFLKTYRGYNIDLPKLGVVYVTLKESGPAHTLSVCGLIDDKSVKMDIDLVPCFVFRNHPDMTGFKKLNYSNTRFFVVPKTPKVGGEKFWRLSFQEQEREIINGKNRLKPALKLIKQLRDNENHNSTIASYFIKTIFLWECDVKGSEFWDKKSLSEVLMTMLGNYKKYISNRKIPYYWNQEYNLVGHIPHSTLYGIENRINRIIAHIITFDNQAIIFQYFKPPNSTTPESKSAISDENQDEEQDRALNFLQVAQLSKFAGSVCSALSKPTTPSPTVIVSAQPETQKQGLSTWTKVAIGVGVGVVGVAALAATAAEVQNNQQQRRINEGEQNEEDENPRRDETQEACSVM